MRKTDAGGHLVLSSEAFLPWRGVRLAASMKVVGYSDPPVGKEQAMKAIYVKSREADGHARLARRPITQVMSKPAVVVLTHDLLDEALVKMINKGLRHLAVVDDSGRCVGVLSDRAITSAWATDYEALSHRRVLSALDAEPATMSCSGAVVDAATVMRQTGVDAVAVVDADGRPVGVVTGSDLVALLAK